MPKTPPPELHLVGLNEITTLDRWALERRSRALARSAYLGDGVALCRVLGRYKLYVSTRDVGFGAHMLLEGAWESWLTTFMARLIKPGMRVVDAGANHGYYTILFADLVGPQGKVAAIEPSPTTARLLRQSVSVNGYDGRVQVFENAAMAADDQMLVFHNPVTEPKNARVLGLEPIDHPEVISVPGARVDTMLADWPKVDFMKIDVEGSEAPLLDGAWPILERDTPPILLEFNGTRGADPRGLLDRLASIYSRFQVIDSDTTLRSVTADQLMDPDHPEDWNLFLSR